MRFPNLLETTLLIFSLIVVNLFLKHFIDLPNQDNLKAMLITLIKLALLVLAIMYFLKKRLMDKDYIYLKSPNLLLCLISVVMAVLIVFNPVLGSLSFFKAEDILKYANSIVSTGPDVFMFLNLVVVTPVFEELFFRGIIFNGLRRNYSLILSMLVSSLLFGIFHIDLLGSVVFGLWLNWVMLKTNSMIICILSHAACNLGAFYFRVLAARSELGFFNYLAENYIFISVLMLISALVLFYFFSKRLPSEEHQLEA